MKKNDELSQRDVQKLEAVRKMIGCSAEFRIKTIASIVKNVITESFTDDDAQKAALRLQTKSFAFLNAHATTAFCAKPSSKTRRHLMRI